MCLAIPAQIESVNGFEAKVDIGGVDVRQQFLPGLRIDVAGGDEHIAQALFAGADGGVEGVFVVDDRVGIGIGKRGTVVLSGQRHELFRRARIRPDTLILGIGLRYLPVLTIGAVEITADRRDRKDSGARQEMKERLFFNRINSD